MNDNSTIGLPVWVSGQHDALREDVMGACEPADPHADIHRAIARLVNRAAKLEREVAGIEGRLTAAIEAKDEKERILASLKPETHEW